MFANAPEAIAVLDEHDTSSGTNSQFTTMFGYTRTNPSPQHQRLIVHRNWSWKARS